MPPSTEIGSGMAFVSAMERCPADAKNAVTESVSSDLQKILDSYSTEVYNT